ncbi:MAG: DegV family protein [Firmicutes bacterium]|nr:DegV family protein [Bacillota bacterium]MDY5530675.1 DegV family protein [Pumilibacteraceae bacterium]
MFALFTDTDSDITPAIAKEYGMHIISMPYIVDGKTIYPYEDADFEKNYDCHEFYQKLRKGALPTTAGLSPEKYKSYFEPCFERGEDVLYVHFSTVMSGTFSAMNLAVKELKEKYPERNFYEIDTKGITVLSYAISIAVAEMYKNGDSVEKILAWADSEVQKHAIYFYVDDLKFFARSGRVSNFSAIMGNIVGIHPILTMGADGMMTALGKAQGRKKTLNKILDMIAEKQEDIASHKIYIGHSDMPDVAEIAENMLKERFGENLDVTKVEVNPTAGCHCGPDGLGIVFHAKNR